MLLREVEYARPASVDEAISLLAGYDGARALAGGQTLLVPAGVAHGFTNSGTGTLHVRAILAAAVFEARYDGAAEPVRRWLPLRET